MAVPAPKTLDIKEPQILRHFPNDANAFFWHHRVLLSKVSPGIWVALTPDSDLERIDLHNTDHIQLERRANFPGPQSPYVYAFDELGRGDLERHKRRAMGMAALFNDSNVDDLDSYEWIVADTSHDKFGEVINEQLLDEGTTLGDSGIIVLEQQEVFVRRVARSAKSQVIEQLDASRGDLRLLGSHTDGAGKRFLDLKTALTLVRESPMTDWPLQGPRVTGEFLRAIRSGPGDIVSYHLAWLKGSGVNQHSMIAHDHRIMCNILRNAIEVDQYDVTNSLSLELLCRRLVQIETAVARSPLSPDFSGLEMIMEDTIGTGGEAVTSAFNTWLSSKLKEKAAVAKQTRLYKEEFRKTSANSSDPSTAADDTGGGRGRGSGRGAPDSGAAAQA